MCVRTHSKNGFRILRHFYWVVENELDGFMIKYPLKSHTTG